MRALIIAGVTLAALGCSSLAPKRANLLIEDLRGYNEGVRWRNWGSAAVRLPPGQREAYLDEREADEDLRVDDYEILRIRYRDGRRAARVDVKFTWHLDSRGIVHDTTTRQNWELFGKVWLLLEEYRVRGEPMPGIAEPEPEQDGEDREEDFSATRGGGAPIVVE